MKTNRLLWLTGMCLILSWMTLERETAGQPPTEDGYYWSSGKKIPVKIRTDLLAIQGDRQAVRTNVGKDTFIGGVKEYVDNEDARITALARQRVYVVRIEPSSRNAVRETIRRTGKIRRDGLVAAVPTGAKEALVVITPQFVARFKADVPRERIDAINKANNVEIVEADPFVKNQFTLRPLDVDPARTLELSNRYHELAESDKLSHPNFIVARKTRGAAGNAPQPNDPLFPNQWHLHNTGQGQGKAGADVRALDAWKITQGSPDVIIAVLDPDGVQVNHEDLIANKFVNTKEIADNGVDDDNNGFVDDVSGWNFLHDNHITFSPNLGAHGTAAAGIAVAQANNGRGGCGIAPQCRLLGIMTGNDVVDDARAFRYAAQMGASVISCSWGYDVGTELTQVVEEAITTVATTGRDKKGCVVCFAMTNEKVDNFGGAGGVRDISSHPKVIAVGRCTNLDVWGHCGFGKGMALLAPTSAAKGNANEGCLAGDLAGTLDVTTTDLMGSAGYNNGLGNPNDPSRKCLCNTKASEIQNANYTGCFGGTSSATPLTAGIAALVLSVNPNLTAAEVRDVLLGTADKIDAQLANYQNDTLGRGCSQTHGYGRVNAFAAVQLAQKMKKPMNNPPPPPSNKEQGAPGSFPVDPVLQPAIPAGKPDLSQSHSGVPDLPGSLQAEAAPQIAATRLVRIDGRLARAFDLQLKSEGSQVFVAQDMLAVVLGPNAKPGDVLSELGANAVKTDWAAAFVSRNTLLVEVRFDALDEVNKKLPALYQKRLIQAVGWVVFTDPNKAASVGVLSDKLSIPFQEKVTKEQAQALAEKHQWTVLQQDPLDRGTYVMAPATRTFASVPDSLNAFAQQMRASGLLADNRVIAHWIVPIRKR